VAGLLLVTVLCQFCFTHFPSHSLKKLFRGLTNSECYVKISLKQNIFPEIVYMMQGEEFRMENGKFCIEITNIDKCN